MIKELKRNWFIFRWTLLFHKIIQNSTIENQLILQLINEMKFPFLRKVAVDLRSIGTCGLNENDYFYWSFFEVCKCAEDLCPLSFISPCKLWNLKRNFKWNSFNLVWSTSTSIISHHIISYHDRLVKNVPNNCRNFDPVLCIIIYFLLLCYFACCDWKAILVKSRL